MTTASFAALRAWLGPWTRPSDRPSQAVLAVGVVLLAAAFLPRGPRWLASTVDLPGALDLRSRRRFLMFTSFVAALLSLGYIAWYLRGGPRAPDASTYWLEGRSLSRGWLSWTVPDPATSFRAPELVFRPPDRLSGPFPPAFPMLLAIGFLVGAPMLVGPLLAAALVAATWALAHEVLAEACRAGRRASGSPDPHAESTARPAAEAVARFAAGLSVVSAALRYHTADTLPYGAAACALATALGCAMRARRTGDSRFFGAAGLAVGYLVAAGPSLAISVGLATAALALDAPARARRVAWLAAGALPGVLFLLVANRAATGHAFVSAAPLAVGGAGVDGRTLRDHCLGIVNFEPLALLAIASLIGARPGRAAVWTAMVVVGHVLVQAALSASGSPAAAAPPFAGALAPVLPLEHVLVAAGIARIFRRRFAPAATGVLGLALVGFAVHASSAHDALAAGDLGRPRFEPDVLSAANVTSGLVFFDDDRAFELAADPGAVASHAVEAARRLGDDRDRLLYDALGHPPAHRYIASAAGAAVTFWAPAAVTGTWRFEAENDWPPVARRAAVANAVDGPSACVSGGRALRVTPTAAAGEAATVTLTLPVPVTPVVDGTSPAPPGRGQEERDGKYSFSIVPRVVDVEGGGNGEIWVVDAPAATVPLARWTWKGSRGRAGAVGLSPRCLDLPAQSVRLRDAGGERRARAWLIVRAEGGPLLIDRTTLSVAEAPGAR